MLKIAVVRVLKRYWPMLVTLVIVNEAGLYWRHHALSLAALGWMLLFGPLCLALMALPVELHRLRLEAAGKTVTPRR